MKSQAESDLDNPEEAFAWMFAAGVPDPRGEKHPHQPIIPPKCLPVLSKMIYDMGGRVHPELQAKWVNPPPRQSPTMNFQAWGATPVKPEQIEELVAAEPEVAGVVAGIGERLAKAKNEAEAQAIRDEVQASVIKSLDTIKKYARAKAQ